MARRLSVWCVLVVLAGCATSPTPRGEEVRGEEASGAGGVTVGLLGGGEGGGVEGVGGPGAKECYDAAFLGSPDGGTRPAEVPLPCWQAWLTARVRVTEDRAVALRRLEREHEAKGEPLYAVELGACAGLSETEVALSPFYFREDVLGVAPILEGGEVKGAEVRFRRGIENLDGARLERVVRCHLERAQVVCDPDAMDYCPIAVGEVSVRVSESPEALVVEVRGATEAASVEVLQRVEALRREGER